MTDRTYISNERRELRDLWIAVTIAVSFALYHVLSFFSDNFTASVRKMYPVVSNGLMFWIFFLLWAAYRRWRAAASEHNALRDIVGSISSEVILTVGPDRRITSSNEASLALFGYRSEYLVGKTTDLLYGDRRVNQSHAGEIREALDKTGRHLGFATGLRSTGEQFPLEISTALLGKKHEAVLILRDITERKKAEAAITQAKEAAERSYERLRELEKMRDNLTHMIIHDMRTPLQILLANQELMRNLSDPTLPNEAREMLDEMVGPTMILTEMTNAVLDVSRMESGKVKLNKKDVDLSDLIRSTVQALAPIAKYHDVADEIGETAYHVQCDSDLIRRVIINLVVNAIKYTPQNSRIRVSAVKNADSVRVDVTDNGPGIAPENHATIFEKFGRVRGSKTTAHSVGLGLTFCKLAIEAHGGQIGVESRMGEGATFWFVLPA